MDNAEVLIKFKADTSDVKNATNNMSSSFGSLTKSVTLGNLAAKGITKSLQVMSQNMDSAINRVDTFNQYPKVLQNFGVSVDEADASIKRIDKTVRGLPTSLDQAVAGVQDLFTVTNDLDQAEKMFRAVNDSAMVFAGGSTEASKRFLYAYKQVLAQGKVSAQDFNQMNEAIPGVLAKVAQSMDMNMATLKAGLSDGSISVDQFNEALLKLDSEGGAGMESLQSVALTSTGGIATSFANMKTAIVRGVSNMLTKLDEGLKPFGGISGVLSNIGKVGEQVFSTLGNAIGAVIPHIINIFNWLSEHKTLIMTLTSIVIGFVAAFKTISVVVGIINGIKTAFALLNIVMMANPIGLIIGLIAGLVAGFIYLWNHCEGFRNFWIGLWNGIKAVVQPIIDFIVALFQTLWSIIQPIVSAIGSLFKAVFTTIWNIVSPIINLIIGIFQTLWSIISPIIQMLGAIFSSVFGVIRDVAVAVFGKIKAFVMPIINGFVTAFKAVGNAVKTVFDGVKSVITKVFNTIGGIIKAPINGIIGGINKVIGMMNKIKIPDWVPGIGGKGINIKPLPKLATGTNYVPQDMLAYIHKGEAVIPKKFNPYANTISEPMLNSMQISKETKINIIVENNMELDPLGQVVSNIKTFSGGAKNDYNYGKGA